MFEEQVREVERLVEVQNRWRLGETLNLIASENVMSERARGLMGSDFCHRYAEGHPGERYYQGTDHIDRIETVVKGLLRQMFSCAHVEVRAISGTNANEAVFSSFVGHGDVVFVTSVPGGGHISHQRLGTMGKYTKNVIYFPLAEDGYHIDVGRTKDLIRAVHPTTLVFGKSLFLFPDPISELKEICEENKIRMIYDGAHVLGLIAGKQFQDPLREGAEILVGSTHKTFPGSQRGVILSNLGDQDWRRIDKGAFPGSSSNHHLDTLPPLLVTTYEMVQFGEAYARQTVANAKVLAAALDRSGFVVEGKAFGYTESHQVALDVARHGGGARVAEFLRQNDIILNMNLLPRDSRRALANPSGVRMGVQEVTRAGMKEPEMEQIARLIKTCVIDGKNVRDEVRRLRSAFTRVQYSFDDAKVGAGK